MANPAFVWWPTMTRLLETKSLKLPLKSPSQCAQSEPGLFFSTSLKHQHYLKACSGCLSFLPQRLGAHQKGFFLCVSAIKTHPLMQPYGRECVSAYSIRLSALHIPWVDVLSRLEFIKKVFFCVCFISFYVIYNPSFHDNKKLIVCTRLRLFLSFLSVVHFV